MARKKVRFTINKGRFDPYKNFKFRIAIGSVIAAIAGFGILKKLRGTASTKYLDPKDYLPPEPTPPPPIGGVGTTTAGRAGTAPKGGRAVRAKSLRRRKQAGTRKTGGPKPR